VAVAIGATVAAASLCVLTACGSSGQASGAAALHDAVALQQAVAAGRSTDTAAEVGLLMSTAQSLPGDREGWKGAALLRTRLPRVVRRFLADYEQTRPRLEHVRTRTTAGARLKVLAVESFDVRRRELLRLRAAVSGSTYAWGDVLRWTEENDREMTRLERQLAAILRTLPPYVRAEVEYAIAG
jgi:hypothetical protein